ncbi:FAD/NAD-P-binding domain-containing protein [Trametes elegans]|nr:FAD/NAD-P-binding domain-containing protein [Trametes elegans]
MTVNAQLVASSWLDSLASALERGEAESLSALFLPDGWLRDVLVFTWDIRSLEGSDKIKSYLAERAAEAQITDVKLDNGAHLSPEISFIPQLQVADVELALTFECRNGHGRGYARLLQEKDGGYKALSLMLMLSDLRGHEESTTLTLREDVTGIHNRDMQQDFAAWVKANETDPYVLVVGGAQAGLQVAARLKAMNIRTLVIEREPRIGDVWRKRYPTLTLHTIKRQHTLLYTPYPDNWPEYTPRDKLADWLEQYASIQDLVVWTDSELKPHPIYDPTTATWTATILRGGKEEITLRPAHIVIATGTLGAPNIPSLPGRAAFPGAVLHSEGYNGGGGLRGQRVVVVGAGNSAIDICQDAVLHRARAVTMVQRSPTCVLERAFVSGLLRGRWPDRWPIDVADFKGAAWPIGLQKKLAIASQDAVWAAQRELHDKLRRGGVRLNMGPEGEGLYLLTLERLGGYWQDKGGADLIADGRIQVKQGTLSHFSEAGLVLNDGTELPADTVVFATGYQSMRETNRKLLGDDIINQTEEIYGLDEEGELRGSYRPSGHPGLWYATGDFFISRFNSKPLALQIKARQLGLI